MRKAHGFTLLEVVLAIVISATLLTAIMILNAPFLKEFNEAFVFQRLRHGVTSPLDAMAKEIKDARVAYVDANQCYAVCLVDKTSGNRVTYYWSGSDLYRKSEAVSVTLDCNNGKTFALGLDKPNSAFTQLADLVSLKLTQTSSQGSSYKLSASILPTNAERTEPFFDNFSCLSSAGKGWTLDTGDISWAIEASNGGTGAYALKETLATDQGSAILAKAEIPLNLGRISKAYLQFKYRASAAMVAGEKLVVSYYDGTSWTQVFVDDLFGAVGALATNTIDLDGYTLSRNSRIKFEGYLKDSDSAWYIDEVSVVAK